MEQITLNTVESVAITTLVDNTIDALLLDDGPVKRLPMTIGPKPVDAAFIEGGRGASFPRAEHGVSFLVEVAVNGTSHRVLFDAGLSPDGLIANMRILEVDPTEIEAIVLSHGHFDHTTGIDGLADALGRRNMPVMIHPEFWSQRRVTIPGRDPFELPTTSKSALEGAGFDIIEREQPSFLLDGALLVTGEVDRTTDFERGFVIHQAQRGGTWEPDPLILDDQALIANVAGKGLVIITGCGHAGIINIVRYATALTGVGQVHAIIGGFHLGGPLFEPIIPATVEALKSFAPSLIAPAHCTGWTAIRALNDALPDAFVQSSVGTRYEL